MSFSADDFAKALEQYDYAFKRGQVVRGKPASYASDGLYVDIGGKSAAFLPTEEASLRRVTDLEVLFPPDEEHEFLIVRDANEEGQVTLSVRQLELRKVWKRLVEMQETHESLQARVSGVNKGGVTVDVQSIRGFIPRSHLTEGKDNLESLVGKALTVTPLEVIPASKKLVLSQRLATQAASMSQLEIGQLIDGRISGIKPFGLFIEFYGVTGLLHINQISGKYISALESQFEVGQAMKAVILDIDDIKRRISLSTKVLEAYPGEILENMAEVMTAADVRAKKLAQAKQAAQAAAAAEAAEAEVAESAAPVPDLVAPDAPDDAGAPAEGEPA